MPRHEDYFDGHDGRRLYQQCWLPETEPTAVVVVVHGVKEHGGRYARLAGELNHQGYAVYAADLRGHGKSAGARVHIRRFDEYLADLEVFLQLVRTREPGKPVFLLGHSMGGAIVTHLAITRKPEVRGIVLSAPAISVGSGVFPLLRRLASFFSMVLPYLRFVRFGYRYLSRDEEVLAEYRDDPLVFHRRFPIRTGAEILRVGDEILRSAGSLRLPLLILHGTGDVVTDVEGSRRLCRRAASKDKTLHVYEGLYHEVLSEPEREHVLADLIKWLETRRSRSRK